MGDTATETFGRSIGVTVGSAVPPTSGSSVKTLPKLFPETVPWFETWGDARAYDGTASIIYVYGPLEANARVPGGVLHGTGVIRDDELRFQNSDGTQFAFRPAIADLVGQMTTPNGQTYQAAFKKTL